MSEIYELMSIQNSAEAQKIIEELQIRKAWQSIGAEVNLVGSLACGLLCKHLDIDFHVYSDIVNIEDSFRVVAKLATNKFVKKVSYLRRSLFAMAAYLRNGTGEKLANRYCPYKKE